MIRNVLNDTFNNHKNVWFDYQTAKRNGIVEYDKNVCFNHNHNCINYNIKFNELNSIMKMLNWIYYSKKDYLLRNFILLFNFLSVVYTS